MMLIIKNLSGNKVISLDSAAGHQGADYCKVFRHPRRIYPPITIERVERVENVSYAGGTPRPSPDMPKPAN